MTRKTKKIAQKGREDLTTPPLPMDDEIADRRGQFAKLSRSAQANERGSRAPSLLPSSRCCARIQG